MSKQQGAQMRERRAHSPQEEMLPQRGGRGLPSLGEWIGEAIPMQQEPEPESQQIRYEEVSTQQAEQEPPLLRRLRAEVEAGRRRLGEKQESNNNGRILRSSLAADREVAPTAEAHATLQRQRRQLPPPGSPKTIGGRRHSIHASTPQQASAPALASVPLSSTAYYMIPMVDQWDVAFVLDRHDRHETKGRQASMPETPSHSMYSASQASAQLHHEASAQRLRHQPSFHRLEVRELSAAESFRSRVMRHLSTSWRFAVAIFRKWIPSYVAWSFFILIHYGMLSQQWIRRMLLSPRAAMFWIPCSCLVISLLGSVPPPQWSPNRIPTNFSSHTRKPLTLTIADTNEALAGVISHSTNMRVLPYFIQKSIGAITNLGVVVKYSPVGSRVQLHTECEEYTVLAHSSMLELTTFFVRLNSLIYRAVRTTNSTITDIDKLYTDSKTKCSRSAAWLAWTNDNILVTSLGFSPVCSVAEGQTAAQIMDHVETISPEIQRRVDEGIKLFRHFRELEQRILSIQDLAFAENGKVGRQKTDIIHKRPMWAKWWLRLGGSALDGFHLLEEQVAVLDKVPDYIRDVQNIVQTTIVSLGEITNRFDNLNRRLAESVVRHTNPNPTDSPTDHDLEILRVGMENLATLHKVAMLKDKEEMKEVFQFGMPKSSMYDYQIIKDGGKIEMIVE